MNNTREWVLPTPAPEASFETLRASLKMHKEYFAKKDWLRASILAKQVVRIKFEMLEQADESFRHSLERHIEDIILNG